MATSLINARALRIRQDQRPFLIVFSGLPGMGKTTVPKALAARPRAVYLRIDTIVQAMKSARAERMGPAGYAVANALAADNRLLGRSMVADCVNPVREIRLGWSKVAAQASASLVHIQLICSDSAEHGHRVERRSAHIPASFCRAGKPKIRPRGLLLRGQPACVSKSLSIGGGSGGPIQISPGSVLSGAHMVLAPARGACSHCR
jgi:predicted kinase